VPPPPPPTTTTTVMAAAVASLWLAKCKGRAIAAAQQQQVAAGELEHVQACKHAKGERFE
jgi:hypothetical protein